MLKIRIALDAMCCENIASGRISLNLIPRAFPFEKSWDFTRRKFKKITNRATKTAKTFILSIFKSRLNLKPLTQMIVKHYLIKT